MSLRDFRHASKVFTTTGGYPLTPKMGYSFHVRVVYNVNSYTTDSNTVSVLVKSVDLPKFNIDTDVMNKYNKKEIIQKKLSYEPVNIAFHDDSSGVIRDFWLDYNQYYFADSSVDADSYLNNDTYSTRTATKYGLDIEHEERFLKQIEIYSMGNHRYTKYVLINPIIESFDFDTHDYADGSKVMQSQMRVVFENVKYYAGSTSEIPGFGDNSSYYDKEYSYNSGSDLSIDGSPVYETEIDLSADDTSFSNETYESTIQPIITLTSNIIDKAVVSSSSSSSSSKRFSFPTASIKDSSSAISLTTNDVSTQGVQSRSTIVSSNGSTVSVSASSSLGSVNLSSSSSVLYVSPKVPAGLTTAETAIFNESYPSLPSTDARTKSAPYV